MKKLYLLLLSLLFTVVPGQNKKLYGVTRHGGTNNVGVIFEFDIATNLLVKKIDFKDIETGKTPVGGLVHTSNGKIYGMTEYGGAFNNGVIFEYDLLTSTFTKKYEFNSTNNGRVPYGTLVKSPNGKLYGVTQYGGSLNKGTLFEYDPINNIYSKKADFIDSNGNWPQGNLVVSTNGKIYGTTISGGPSGSGTLFEYDIQAVKLTKKVDFNCFYDGCRPTTIVQTSNNTYYGINTDGTSRSMGSIYSYNSDSNKVTIKYEFSALGDSGYNLVEGMLLASNGLLYGTTYSSGVSNYGTFFSYDPVLGKYNKISEYNLGTGTKPAGLLIEGTNGKLYGMTVGGGTTSDGTLVEYDITTGIITKKADFNKLSTGSSPFRNSLLEVDLDAVLGVQNIIAAKTFSYPNPVRNILYFSQEMRLFDIISLDGKVVKRNRTGKAIDLSDLPAGIYIVQGVDRSGNIINQKIIKE